MKYDFDRVINRSNTSCLKWDELGSRFGAKELLPMWVADMDFQTAAPVVKALEELAAWGVYGYPARPVPLFDAIAGWMSRRHGWEIRKPWLSVSSGVVPSLKLALSAFSHPGDKVIVQPPVYHPFFSTVQNSGRQIVENPLKLENGRYVMDLEDLEKKFDQRTKLVFLCSPHNPGGRVWSREELAAFGEVCLRHGVTIVSDEIHCDLVFHGAKHVPIASISEELAQNSVTCIAPSKTFNLAGLSTSAVIIPNSQLLASFSNAMESAVMGAHNIFGLKAAEVAYREGDEWLDQLTAYIQGNLDLVASYVGQRIPKIKAMIPEGSYLVWLDCREIGKTTAELKHLFIDNARVAMNDGAMFGTGGEGFMRLNVACPRSTVEEALRRIEQAVS